MKSHVLRRVLVAVLLATAMIVPMLQSAPARVPALQSGSGTSSGADGGDVAKTGLPSCPAGVAAPKVVLERPMPEDVVNWTTLTIRGTVETAAELTEARLSVANQEIMGSKDFPTKIIPPNGGMFGPVS